MAVTDFKLTDAVLRRMIHDQMDKLAEAEIDTSERREIFDREYQRTQGMFSLGKLVLEIEKVRVQSTMAKIKADKYYGSKEGNSRVQIESDFFEENIAPKRLNS